MSRLEASPTERAPEAVVAETVNVYTPRGSRQAKRAVCAALSVMRGRFKVLTTRPAAFAMVIVTSAVPAAAAWFTR